MALTRQNPSGIAPDWAFDLLASFDRFVPPELTCPTARRRSQLIVMFSAVGAVTACALALATPLVDLGTGYVVSFFAIGLWTALAPFVLRATRSTSIAAHMFSLAWLASVCIGLYARGGVDNVAAPCLAPLPLIATLLGGRRAGAVWLVGGIVTIVAFALAPRFGVPLVDRIPERFHGTYAIITIVTLLLMLILFATAYVALEVASSRTVDAAVMDQRAAENEARMLRAGRLATLGEVAASLVHEINNPLMYVMANLEFLLEDKKLDPATREASVDAHEGAQRIASIVKDLKAYASSDERTIEPLDLAVVAQSTARLVRGYLRKRAQLELELEPSPPVDGNWAQLSQVVINLVVNAAQAVPVGELATNEVTLRTGVADGQPFLEVQDNGCGISAEDLELINTRSAVAEPNSSSTHLGLQVTKNIVARLGGVLTIESTVDVGTRARINFERAVPDEVGERRWAGEPSLTVLVIDSDPLVHGALRRMLVGHEIIAVDSLDEASSAFVRDVAPDLVLLDLDENDAWGWFQSMRVEHPSVASNVVFLASGMALDEAPEVLAEMPERLVLKPLDRERLRELIDEHVSSPRATELPNVG